MPVNILSRISEQPQYTGSGSNTALVGNVGDWVQTIINFRAYTGFESGNVSLTVQTNNFLVLSSGTWEELGFTAGVDLIGELNYSNNPNNSNNSTTLDISTLGLTVVSVNGSMMEISGQLLNSGSNYQIPGITGNYIINYINLYAEDPITAVEFSYNQILNSTNNAPTLNSLLDGTVTALRGSGLDASDLVTITTLTPKNIQSGCSIDSVTIQGKGITDAFSDFELVVVHSIVGIYDQSTDIENKTKPSWFASTECLGDIYQIKCYRTAFDETTAVSSALNDGKLIAVGNTGWYDENFNGGQKNYSLIDVTFEDATATQISGISHEGQSTIRFSVIGAGFTTTDSEFNFGISLNPINRVPLGNKNFTNLQMLCANTMGVLQSYGHTAAPVVSTIAGFTNDQGAQIDITSYHFEVISANQVDVEIIVDVNAAFTQYVNDLGLNDNLFSFWCSVGTEGALATTDRINLIFSNQVYIAPVVPQTLEDIIGFGFYPNELDFYTDPLTFTGEGTIFAPEDDYHFSVAFLFEAGAVIKTGRVGLEIYNTTTDETVYNLDEVSVNLANSLVQLDGTQIINYTAPRQFEYEPTFKNNQIQWVRVPSQDVGNDKAYRFVTPFRMRWEWWIENGLVPTDFFDTSEPNDNLNNEWSTKIPTGYGIRQYLFLDTEDVNGTQIQYEKKYAISIKPYNDDKTITHEIKTYGDNTFVSDELFLAAAKTNKYTEPVYGILENNETFVSCVMSRAGYDFTNFYGEITLEIENGAGWLSMWKIRSDSTPQPNNPLQPLSGQTTAQVITGTNEVEIRCRIEPSLIPQGSVNFKISAVYSGRYAPEGGGEGTDYLERTFIWADVVDDRVFEDEEQEFPDVCCYKLPVFGSTVDSSRYKNDIKGLFAGKRAQTIEWFLIRCSDETEYPLNDNTYGTYFPVGSYTYEPLAKYYQLQWRKVLELLGAGTYVIKTVQSLFARPSTTSYSCPYELKEFSFKLANNTVRIESVMNGYLEDSGFNYKGLNIADDLRFGGKFGYEEHSYEQTFEIKTNNDQALNRSDLTSEFILNSHLIPHVCVAQPLFNYFLRSTSIYISDYNNDNHNYDYRSFPVVLVNPEEETYYSQNRNVKVSIRFKERVLKRRTSTCVGERTLPFLSENYVFDDQCPAIGDPKDLFWQLDFQDGDDVAFVQTDALSEGTLSTVFSSTNVGTIEISTDNVTFVAFTLPFVPTLGTDYYFRRSITSGVGQYTLQGNYV